MSISEGLFDYLFSIETSLSSYRIQLDDLNQIITERKLSVHEYNSSERLLQLSTEACIGLAKHWVKLIFGSAPSSAYDNFIHLKRADKIDQATLVLWKKIIGTRNNLVYEYLEIDQELIKSIIANKEYKEVFEFASSIIKALRSNNP